MALSMSVSAGKHNPRHNTDLEYRRKLEHVDPELTKYNVTLADEGRANAYARLFGAALAKHNAAQVSKGHPERQIADYEHKVVEAWKADQRKVVAGAKQRGNVPAPQYEYVIQIGNRDTWRDELTIEQYKRIYQDTWDRVRERTAGAIDWYQAAIHYDEPNGTPHLHMVGIPYGTGCKRGLETQVSMSRALEKLGLQRLPDLQAAIMTELESAAQEHGVEREYMGCDRAHQDVPAYRQTMRDLADATEKLERQRERLAELTEEVEIAREAAQEAQEQLESVLEARDRPVALSELPKGVGGLVRREHAERAIAERDAEIERLECKVEELEAYAERADERMTLLQRVIERAADLLDRYALPIKGTALGNGLRKAAGLSQRGADWYRQAREECPYKDELARAERQARQDAQRQRERKRSRNVERDYGMEL